MSSTRSSDLLGRVALVTGAAGDGVGQAVARRLAVDGARVVLLDVHERRLAGAVEKIVAEVGDRARGYVVDVTDFPRVEEILHEIDAQLGPVQILVNNVAINVLKGLTECTLEEWESALRLNLTAAFHLCRCTLPGMRAAGGGSIINISSVAAEAGLGWEAPYAVSKAGLQALSRACADEGGPHNIRSNVVTMGLVAGTRSAEFRPQLLDELRKQTPLGSFPRPDDIADAVAFLVSDGARFITGEILGVSSGWYMRS